MTDKTKVEHTPEPWRLRERGIVHVLGDNEDKEVLICRLNDGLIHQHEANRRRIVACVNYCAGMATYELEGGLMKDGLLAIVEKQLTSTGHTNTCNHIHRFSDGCGGDCQEIRAEIARAKGVDGD